MAAKLLKTPHNLHLQPSKPKIPVFSDDNIPNLVSLIGARSWLLFNLLKLDNSQLDWLQVPVKYWDKMESYKKIEKFVVNLEVVNDCAERDVKLITDFKDMVEDKDQLQCIFQVVEDHRQRVSFNGPKSSLNYM